MENEHCKNNSSAAGFNLVFFSIQREHTPGFNVHHKDMTAKASFSKKNTIMTYFRMLFLMGCHGYDQTFRRLLKIHVAPDTSTYTMFSTIHVLTGKLPLPCLLLPAQIWIGLIYILTLQALGVCFTSLAIKPFYFSWVVLGVLVFFFPLAGTAQLRVKKSKTRKK